MAGENKIRMEKLEVKKMDKDGFTDIYWQGEAGR
jgi:hypothetical protein